MLIPFYSFRALFFPPVHDCCFYSYSFVELTWISYMGQVVGGDLQQGRFLILGRDAYLRQDLRMAFQTSTRKTGKCSSVEK